MTLLALVPWLWHPLGVCPRHPSWQYVACRSYNFWSGVGSDLQEIALPVTIVGALLWGRRFLRQHLECHEETCRRIGLHHYGHHRVCWEHHPVLGQHPRHRVPLHVIHGLEPTSASRGDDS